MDDEAISYSLQQLHTRNSEDAFFALLIHLSDSDIPCLIKAYDTETDTRIKAILVEIIWQQRSPESLNFLVTALQHSETEIWREALDGIVAIGTQQATLLLQVEMARLSKIATREAQSRLEWIEEAIQQLSE